MNTFYTDMSVDSYVFIPNHIHIMLRVMKKMDKTSVCTVQNTTVSRFVSTFKRFCNKEYGNNIWQPRSYDHVIRDQEDYDKHLQYIYENPFGWAKDDLYPKI